jgi:hypothetical protein
MIAIHDCLPIDVFMAGRQDDPERRRAEGSKQHRWWTGDVWKLIPILKFWRPDLNIICVDCAPTGMLLVTNLNPESRTLTENYHIIVEEFANLELYEYGLQKLHLDAEIRGAGSLKYPILPWNTSRVERM